MNRLLTLLTCLCLLAAPALAAPPPEIPITENDEQTLVFTFAGDCTLGSEGGHQGTRDHFVPVITELGLEHPFSGVQAVFTADDVTLVNLEGTFTTYDKANEKRFVFRAPPEFAEILPLGSVEAVNLANNHTLDFKQRGYNDTLEALQAHGIPYCDLEHPALIEADGVKIGLFGIASPRPAKINTVIAQMEELRAQGAQVFIVSLHWGVEYSARQSAGQQEYARQLIDAGADIIVGTHPHVLHGVELYQGRPIFYSLGNFSFGGNKNPRDWDTMMTQVCFDLTGKTPEISEIRLIPCVVSDRPVGTVQDYRPVPVVGEHAQQILTRVGKISEGFPESFFETGYYKP